MRRTTLLTGLILALLLSAMLSPAAQASNKRPYGEVIATCTSITFVYNNFPNANNNTVTQKVFVHGVLVEEGSFTFNGPTGSDTIPISVPPGLGQVDGRAKWETNGLTGGYDISTALNCAKPAFTIEKLQEIEGSGEGFTTEPVSGKPGKTVDYEILVKNTGNVPLTFGPLNDAKCTGITGGPSGALAPGETATYFCHHELTEANETTGSYTNSATVTGTPPPHESDGPPIHHTSNTVVVHFPGSNERENGEVEATCHSITFTYRGFPNANNNTVTEKVYVHGVLVVTRIFHFNGPSGSDTIPITVPPGIGMVDGRASWNTNGFKGGWDIGIGITCPVAPAFSIVKEQTIEGSGKPFTTAPLTGTVGQTVDYQVVVTNTGNTPLTFSNFTDTHCESIAGGPVGAVAPGGSATYTCDHPLTLAEAGTTYENVASDTGTSTEGGAPITHESNTVATFVEEEPI
ncbi:MAG TPA: hypothetical protein VKG82_00540 [Solirubrobacteraceae bacterium]|nr:hypothetical protein [Solirubrobacteraceae bacterium]